MDKMKKVKLGNKNLFSLVDDSDFDWLNQRKWRLSTQGYAITGKKKIILMHRLINKTNGITDHINQNKLDNRRFNLRTVSGMENGRNRGKNKNNTSGYKGVSWDKSKNSWLAYIKVNYRMLFLGRFKDIKEAVKARKKGEKIYFTYEHA